MEKMGRRFLFIIICMLSFTVPAWANESKIQVFLNHELLQFSSPPILENGRVLVPVRELFQSMGFDIKWNPKEQQIVGEKDDLILTMYIGNTTVTKNHENIHLDIPPMIKENKTYVPLRFVAESTSANVEWNNRKKRVTISTERRKPESYASSVVKIQTNKMQGSGVIVSDDGYIVTNYHVLENAKTAQIAFQDGSFYQGNITLVGCIPSRDIALIKIEKVGLPPVKIAGSNTLHQQDKVTTISSPGGQLNIISYGVIKGYNKEIICTSAVIDHGSSGGALFNERGEVIGIVSSFGGQNYYAIPVKYILEIPRNLNVPLEKISEVPNDLQPPKHFTTTMDNDGVHIFWEPLYGVDYYNLYISPTENGPFTKVMNPKNQTDQWFWGFPHCFGLSMKQSSEFYFKIVAVRDGQKSLPSKITKVTVK